MRVLILGGTGLISTSIVKQLVSAGVDVTVYNRGKRASTPAGVSQLTGDRYDEPAFVDQIAGTGSWDAVIEMIGFDEVHAKTLRKAFAGRTKQLIFCSTVDVYARPAGRYPYLEDEPYGNSSPYAIGKVEAEQELLKGHSAGEFALTIIRPAHTYWNSGAIIHSLGWSNVFVARLRAGLPVVVHGDGQSLWASAHADDVATAFVAALGNAKSMGQAYHAAGSEWLTWNQYAAIAAKSFGGPEPIFVHIPTRELLRLAPDEAAVTGYNFSLNNIFDNSKAAADLGYAPKISWAEGTARIAASLDAEGRMPDPVDAKYEQVITRWQAAIRDL